MSKQPRKKNGQFTYRRSITPPNAAPRLPRKIETVEKAFDIHRMRLIALMMEDNYTRKRAAQYVSLLNDEDVYRSIEYRKNK